MEYHASLGKRETEKESIGHGAGSYEISYSVLLKHLSSNLTKSIMSRGQLCVSGH